MDVISPSEQLFFTTVRIDTVHADGTPGSGTGFLFRYFIDDEDYPFVVTNKHVVRDAVRGSITFLQADDGVPKLGVPATIDVPCWGDLWFGHPDDDIDIALAPFTPLQQAILTQNNVEIYARFITNHQIPSDEEKDALDAIESITFIGYPNGIWDKANLLPIARRGTTATPIGVDFENEPKFLIDASVFRGSSGSPVFVFDKGIFSTKAGEVHVGNRLFFVGVVASVYFHTEQNEIFEAPIPTSKKKLLAQQNEMLDLGVVIKARTVVEAAKALVALAKANDHAPQR